MTAIVESSASCHPRIHDFRIDRKCDSDSGISQSRHSRRIVPMTLSQIAVAIGLRGGDLKTLTPSFVIDSSDHDEHVQLAERCCHGDEEITGNEPLSVQPQKCRPSQLSVDAWVVSEGTTVRGETWICSFTSSSLAIRSSPHVGFSLAIGRIRA